MKRLVSAAAAASVLGLSVFLTGCSESSTGGDRMGTANTRMNDGKMSGMDRMNDGKMSDGKMGQSRMSDDRMGRDKMADGKMNPGKMSDGKMAGK